MPALSRVSGVGGPRAVCRGSSRRSRGAPGGSRQAPGWSRGWSPGAGPALLQLNPQCPVGDALAAGTRGCGGSCVCGRWDARPHSTRVPDAPGPGPTRGRARASSPVGQWPSYGGCPGSRLVPGSDSTPASAPSDQLLRDKGERKQTGAWLLESRCVTATYPCFRWGP